MTFLKYILPTLPSGNQGSIQKEKVHIDCEKGAQQLAF